MSRDTAKPHNDLKTELMDEFHDYDDAVTCVACWHYLLTQTSNYEPHVRHFSWFPNLDLGDRKKTPDFTVLLPSAGLVAEVKSGLPESDTAFAEKLAQLAAYANLTELPSDTKGTTARAGVVDVVLLLRRKYAYRDAERILSVVLDPSSEFYMKKPPIIMGYAIENLRDRTFFVIERVHQTGNGVFQRIGNAPSSDDLYSYFCEQRRSMSLLPEHFYRAKTQFMVMNDAPKRVYIASVLWQELLGMAAAGGQLDMRSARPRSVELEVDPYEISHRLSEKILADHVFTVNCVRDGLDFLRKAGLAARSQSSASTYKVRVQPLLGNRSSKQGSVGDARDLAEQLAERYVRGMKPSTTASPSESSSLDGQSSQLDLF